MSRRSSRKRTVRLKGWERIVFIIGAVLYLVGVFGGINLLAMSMTATLILLIIGGGCSLVVTFRMMF